MIMCVQLMMYCPTAILKVICHWLFAVSLHYLMIVFTFNFGYGIDGTLGNIISNVHLYVHVQLSRSDVKAYILDTLYATNDAAMVNHCR